MWGSGEERLENVREICERWQRLYEQMGVYQEVKGLESNKRKVWSMLGGQHFLYYSSDNYWTVGSEADMKSGERSDHSLCAKASRTSRHLEDNQLRHTGSALRENADNSILGC